MEMKGTTIVRGVNFVSSYGPNTAAQADGLDAPPPPISRAIQRLRGVVVDRLGEGVDGLHSRLRPVLTPLSEKALAEVAGVVANVDELAAEQSDVACALDELAELVGARCDQIERMLTRIEV